MSMPAETQIAQAKANIGRVGRSIKYPTLTFVIDDYIIIDSKISYRITYVHNGVDSYQHGEDTEILPDVQAYKNLATGQIYVSTHGMHKPNPDSDYAKSYLETRGVKPPIVFTSRYDTKDVEILDDKETGPFIAISSETEEMIYCIDSVDAREVALMLLHAADVMEDTK